MTEETINIFVFTYIRVCVYVYVYTHTHTHIFKSSCATWGDNIPLPRAIVIINLRETSMPGRGTLSCNLGQRGSRDSQILKVRPRCWMNGAGTDLEVSSMRTSSPSIGRCSTG